MPVEFKDYYAALGVARDATPDTIKAAFRKLARKYHPDVAKEKQTAEAKFKEINEAYEVLGDPEKRRKYDELGADWERGYPPPNGAGRGARTGTAPGGGTHEEFHFGGTGFSDFFEQFFGRGRQSANFEEVFRNARQRDGTAEAYAERGGDVEGDILVTLDEVLRGSLRAINLRRVNPQTSESETESFKVRIPPGAQDARRIRVPGKGQPGQSGAPAGDLYLRVRIAAHPDFDVRGADLYHEIELTPWEAVLGTHVMVPTLDGTIKLRIPPGTTTGRELRIRGHGLPRAKTGERGDLYASVRVQVPEVVTPEERVLWEKLAHASKFNPREDA